MNLSKIGQYKEFNPLKYLSKNYRYKSKINTYLNKDTIYLYKNFSIKVRIAYKTFNIFLFLINPKTCNPRR